MSSRERHRERAPDVWPRWLQQANKQRKRRRKKNWSSIAARGHTCRSRDTRTEMRHRSPDTRGDCAHANGEAEEGGRRSDRMFYIRTRRKQKMMQQNPAGGEQRRNMHPVHVPRATAWNINESDQDRFSAGYQIINLRERQPATALITDQSVLSPCFFQRRLFASFMSGFSTGLLLLLLVAILVILIFLIILFQRQTIRSGQFELETSLRVLRCSI